MKRLLVVAYNFPPCSVSGTHRTLGFVKYLARDGWQSIVLCARNPVDPERDWNLLAKVPEGTRVIRTVDVNLPAWRERLRGRRGTDAGNGDKSGNAGRPPEAESGLRYLKRYLGVRLRVPDHYQGWYLHTLLAGWHTLKRCRIDALYSTAPPWTGHMVAHRLARAFGIPWVADFRDPWVSDPFTDIPFETLRRQNAKGEAQTLDTADAIVCVLETMRQDFLARYPRRLGDDVVTIPNGFDPDDYTDLPTESDGTLTILHAGQIYGRRRVDPLLAALNEWRRVDPELTASVKVQLVGGSPEHLENLQAVIQRYQSQSYVQVEPEVPHREILGRLSRATILLLVGFSGPGAQYQMSGKIFEYLAIRRPILALAPPSCPVGDILRETGVRHWIVSPDDGAGLVQALKDIGEDWKSGRLFGPQSHARIDAYDRREQAKRLARVLDRAIASRAADAQAGSGGARK